MIDGTVIIIVLSVIFAILLAILIFVSVFVYKKYKRMSGELNDTHKKKNDRK
ncbi:MAG: hypothetical protein HRS57_01890 [Mycoplasmataceae bacterium]|nr:hypothetical protein [Mycoplasmataceae bacterium]